jgi:hypothetical protein
MGAILARGIHPLDQRKPISITSNFATAIGSGIITGGPVIALHY